MSFDLNKSLEILRRTPDVLKTLLEGLPDDWTKHNEGPETWSPFDVVGHLLHGEKTDWIARTKIILSDKADKVFEPFDRFAQFKDNEGKKLDELLTEFKKRRLENLQILEELKTTDDMLDRTGIHPALGEVTLRQLLSTWTVHDLNHIYQISRVMAKQYGDQTGPWIKYLRTLND